MITLALIGSGALFVASLLLLTVDKIGAALILPTRAIRARATGRK